MVIARGSGDNGEEVLIIGLSKENIGWLELGRPISVNSDKNPGVPKGWSICILYGKDEREIEKTLRDAGLFSNNTKIKIDPRLMP